MPLLSLLSGPSARVLGTLGLLLALLIGGRFMLARHDALIRSEMQLQAAQAVASAQAADRAAADTAVAQAHAEADARIARIATIKERTHAAPPSRACADSPAVRAMLDGLRHAGGADPHR